MSIDKQKVNAAAQKHIQKGNYDKAIRELRKLVEDDPTDVRTLLKIGDLFTRKGELDNAIDTYYQVTGYYRDRGFYLKAVAVLKQVAKLAPKRLEVVEDLGELYAAQGLTSDALSQYRQVLSTYQERNQTADVQRVLARMCRIDPRNIGLRIKLAEHLSRSGSTEEAAEQFRIAATQLKEESRTDDYVRVAERLLYHRTDDEATLRELVGVYLQQGQARRALGKLQKLYKLDPRNVETLTLLTQAFIALNQNSKAASVLKELAKIQENTDHDESLATWRRALALTPNDPEVLAALQRHNFTLSGEVPSAQPMVAEAEDEDDEEQFILTLLTECDSFIRLNLLNQALENIDRIFAVDSGNLEAHERRVAIFLKRGQDMTARDALINMAKLSFALDRDRAVEYLRQAADIDPEHSETRELVMAFGLNPADFGLYESTRERPRPAIRQPTPRRSSPNRSDPDRLTSDFPKLQLEDIEAEAESSPSQRPLSSPRLPPVGSRSRMRSQPDDAQPTVVLDQAALEAAQNGGAPAPKPINEGIDDMLGGLDLSIDFDSGLKNLPPPSQTPDIEEIDDAPTPSTPASPTPAAEFDLGLDDDDETDTATAEEPISFELEAAIDDLDIEGSIAAYAFPPIPVSTRAPAPAPVAPVATPEPEPEPTPAPTRRPLGGLGSLGGGGSRLGGLGTLGGLGGLKRSTSPLPSHSAPEPEPEPEPEVDDSLLVEDLQEAEFFLNQGFVNEARQIVEDLMSNFGQDARIMNLKARIDAAL